MNVNYIKLKDVLTNLPNEKKILLCGHENPDMDSIGSCLALARLLKSLGKNPIVLLEGKYLKDIEWFNDNSFIQSEPCIKENEEYIFIELDSNEKSRLGIYKEYYEKAITTIQIDHHEYNEEIADYILAVNEISSTCEIIFNLLCLFDNSIDKKIAELIYSGIVTDTYCFIQRTTPDTFNIASKLLEYGIDYRDITKQNYLNNTNEEAKALSKAILDLKYDGILCYGILDKSDTIYSNITYNSFAKKISPAIQNIQGVQIELMMLVDDNTITVNLRSNCKIEVGKLAKILGGGGHKYGAGATVKDKNVDEIVEIAKEYIKTQTL